ncbi:hypothetical protein K470DRAFT_71435 [Piedraia hortae CBS 480.64]|uniref:Uncharacterized protein n=1 Tax=Piedraia hortae CBS 480.64 TaxID=1314780 RepID=A0A6A7BYR1_9PEZI|nr:hypothetical protein K470DRAFT_71435 [Piedraia hortae CBS 480.64]
MPDDEAGEVFGHHGIQSRRLSSDNLISHERIKWLLESSLDKGCIAQLFPFGLWKVLLPTWAAAGEWFSLPEKKKKLNGLMGCELPRESDQFGDLHQFEIGRRVRRRRKVFFLILPQTTPGSPDVAYGANPFAGHFYYVKPTNGEPQGEIIRWPCILRKPTA